MRIDIVRSFIGIIFISSINIVLSQQQNPTSYPTSYPTTITQNEYFDADIILIVSLLLVSILLSLISLSTIIIIIPFFLDFLCSMYVRVAMSTL